MVVPPVGLEVAAVRLEEVGASPQVRADRPVAPPQTLYALVRVRLGAELEREPRTAMSSMTTRRGEIWVMSSHTSHTKRAPFAGIL